MRLLYGIPPPLWGGGQGEGPFNHQRPIRLTVLPSPQRCCQQTPPQSYGQLPLKGEQVFWSPRQSVPQRLRQTSGKAFFLESPPPLRGGGQGEGSNQPRQPSRYAVFDRNAVLNRHPLRPYGPAPPQRGSKTFWFLDQWQSRHSR